MAQLVKNLPVMQESWVQSLGWEDPLEKGKATHSSILAYPVLIYVFIPNQKGEKEIVVKKNTLEANLLIGALLFHC